MEAARSLELAMSICRRSSSMVFSSQIFLFAFLPLALAIYYAFSWWSSRAQNAVLAGLGYIFYGWAEPRFVILMFVTTFVDWMFSLVVASDSWKFWRSWQNPIEALPKGETRSRTQKSAITFSVVSNLLVLGFFKYGNFTLDSLAAILPQGHLSGHVLNIALPLGISFYTFQSLSYAIDVYRGDARAMTNFVDFSCFVSMFPHLVAGPILKFSFLAEQLRFRTLTWDKFARGIAFFSLGLAKKILLANACAQVADAAFGAGSRSPVQAWLGAIAYSFQIFFDFSGYSDMAIGLGLMLGFLFARNFDAPYHAVSVTDFWRRWHISLSTWLREYLYIPLGGNRKGETRTYFNLFVVMLLGGLWHGASWNFVIWGALHGGALAVERAWSQWKKRRAKFSVQIGTSSTRYSFASRFVGQFFTYAFVVLAWVFFRAETLPQAFDYVRSMFGVGELRAGAQLLNATLLGPQSMVCLAAAGLCAWVLPDTWEWTQKLTWPRAIVCTAVLWLSLLIMATQTYSPFIYFVF